MVRKLAYLFDFIDEPSIAVRKTYAASKTRLAQPMSTGRALGGGKDNDVLAATRNTQMSNHPLSDMQLILLASANQRDDGSVLPTPASIADQNARVRLAIKALLSRALIAEALTRSADQCWREEEDQRVGLFITDAGKDAIVALDAPQGVAAGNSPTEPALGQSTTSSPRSGSKQEALVERLRQENGATIDELTTAFGWLPHTTRAVISGLRKKGYAVENIRKDGLSRYRIAEASA